MVLGSAAVHAPAMVHSLAIEHPGTVVVAVDARDGYVAVEGWTQQTRAPAVDVVRALAGAPLAGILYTDVARDGHAARGPTWTRRRSSRRAPTCRSSRRAASARSATCGRSAARGVAACIVGRALYEGDFTLEEAIAAAAG